jgi:hypothetical protein
MLPLEHRELLSQSEIFQQETTAREKETGNCDPIKPDERQHGSGIAERRDQAIGCKLLILKPSRVLANDRPCTVINILLQIINSMI